MAGTRIIGLTGGIGSGKSTVAAYLRELGVPVIDADELARRVVAPGSPGLQAIVERFGDGVLADDGTLDRKGLGAIVFADEQARRDLNAITHPRIGAASAQEIATYREQGHPAVVYEAPLIVENKLYSWMDALIVVSVPEDVQVQRVMNRDQCDEAAARARIAAQLPLADKIAVADYVVDNAGTVEETRAQVAEIWRTITQADTP